MSIDGAACLLMCAFYVYSNTYMADYSQYVQFTNLQALSFLLLLLYAALQLLILILHFTDVLHEFDVFFVFVFKLILHEQTITVKPEYFRNCTLRTERDVALRELHGPSC